MQLVLNNNNSEGDVQLEFHLLCNLHYYRFIHLIKDMTYCKLVKLM